MECPRTLGNRSPTTPVINDGLYITTAGFGLVDPRVHLDVKRVQPGDRILLSGPIGEIREEPARGVLSISSYGGTRYIDMLVGDPLPRIC